MSDRLVRTGLLLPAAAVYAVALLTTAVPQAAAPVLGLAALGTPKY